MTTMTGKAVFTEGPILKPLLKFTLPIICTLFLQSTYGAVDLIVIGHFAEHGDISAVGNAGSFMLFITNFVIGLVMGMTVTIGNRIGGKKFDLAGRCVGSAVCFFGTVAVAVSVLLLIFSGTIADLLNINEGSRESFVQYLSICGGGMIFIVGYNMVAGIFQASGNSRRPFLFAFIACLINVVGDLLLVGVFGLGAVGVAIATVAAQACSVSMAFVTLRKKALPFAIKREYFRYHGQDILEVVRLGLPIGLQNSLTTLSFLFLISVVNGFGVLFSNGYAVGVKVQAFISIPLKAFCSSLSAFVAQNIGAGRPDRARKALAVGMASAFVVSVALFFVSWFGAPSLTRIFTPDPGSIATATQYLRGFSFDNIVGCFTFCFTGYYNGCRRTYYVLIQSMFAAFAVRVPFAYFMGQLPGVTMFHFGLAAPSASLAGLILYLCFFLHLRKKEGNLGLRS